MKTFHFAIATLVVIHEHVVSGFTGFVTPSAVTSLKSAAASSDTNIPAEELKSKFELLKKAFPKDVDPVAAGGWYNLLKLSGNPKEELVNMVMEGLEESKSKKVEFSSNDEKLAALVTLLYGKGKGFEADGVDGEWTLVFSKQGTKSPKFQKLVGKGEKAGLTSNVFDTSGMTFSGEATVLKKGKVASTVKYTPLSEAYSKTSDGKIVLRRIGCDIIGASWKFWRFPKIPLPLRIKGGYLEFVYMDKDIRVTKGNRGGLFVHFRPEFLKERMSS